MFYVVNDNEKFWATIDKVRAWKTNAAGEIAVPIPQAVIENIIAFREARAVFQIIRAAGLITDAETRKHFSDDVETILNSSGEKRIKALDDLMVTVGASNTSRTEVFQALRFLTNESGYKNNPFLLLAFASASASGSLNINQGAINNAVQAANNGLYGGSTKSYAVKIDRNEAARINLWAGQMYQNIHADNDAANRRWIERFLTMSDDERATYREGEIIEILPPDAVVMGVPTNNAQKLTDLDRKRAERLEMERQINQIGSENPPTDPRYNEYYYKPSDKLEMENAAVPQKQRIMADGSKRAKFKSVTSSQPVYSMGLRADKAGSIVYLVLETFKFVGANRRMGEIAEYYSKREGLLKQVENETRRVVPPKPENLRQAIAHLKRYGRTIRDITVKQNIPFTVRELENMLEESRAFWKID